MLMAELSRRSGVPVATIKYYLREGLLPPGKATAATRAEYSEEHLRRLGLIRALLEIGDIPVSSIKKILAAVDDESIPVHRMLGTMQYELGPHPAAPPEDDPAWQEADNLIADLGWIINPAAPARTVLAAALSVLNRNGTAPRFAPGGADLRVYAHTMASLAALEVPSVELGRSGEAQSRAALAESSVLGMVLFEQVLIALRRLAQEDASARYFGGRERN